MPAKKKWVKKEEGEKEDQVKNLQVFEESFPARVVEIVGKVGVRGEAMQVRCKVLAGRDEGKVLRRNVRGPVRVDDMLMLKETEMEAHKLSGGRRG